MIVTWSANVEHLEYLISSLPDWHFHLAAPVYCIESVTKLSSYPNMTLYQSILHQRIDWLLDDSSVYLDINRGDEVLDVVSRAEERGKKFLLLKILEKKLKIVSMMAFSLSINRRSW